MLAVLATLRLLVMPRTGSSAAGWGSGRAKEKQMGVGRWLMGEAEVGQKATSGGSRCDFQGLLGMEMMVFDKKGPFPASDGVSGVLEEVSFVINGVLVAINKVSVTTTKVLVVPSEVLGASSEVLVMTNEVLETITKVSVATSEVLVVPSKVLEAINEVLVATTKVLVAITKVLVVTMGITSRLAKVSSKAPGMVKKSQKPVPAP